VHVQLNSTCTDGRQFSDWSTSAAGDQSENCNNGGGGFIILAKKGLSLFGICLFLGVPNSRQNKKKRKKGCTRKINKWRERMDRTKLQTETALLMMEAETIALAASCRELFPIMDMVSSVTKSGKLPIRKTTMNVSIHKDNSWALVLAKTLPPQFTPGSKYYALKMIWFCEEIFKRNVQLHKIDTVEQLGNIFTKGLTRLSLSISGRR
jgi:hypothetical protein